MKKYNFISKWQFVAATIVGLSSATTFGQQKLTVDALPNQALVLPTIKKGSGEAKTANCKDTLRYAQAKEQSLGQTLFKRVHIHADTKEKMAQIFHNAGTLTISGVEVIGMNGHNSPATGTNAVVSIYSLDENNMPGTELGTGTSTELFTNVFPNLAHVVVNFATPITVTGNYAVVVGTSTENGVLGLGINDANTGVSYNEELSRHYSEWEDGIAPNEWKKVSERFVDQETNVGIDFEPLVAPIVSYSFTASVEKTEIEVCKGEEVTLKNTSDTTVLNRMNSYIMFNKHFQRPEDKNVFVWDMDGDFSTHEDQVWASETTKTYTEAGPYTLKTVTIGGFAKSCQDVVTVTVTVKESCNENGGGNTGGGENGGGENPGTTPTPPATTGVEELGAISNISIFPNPSTEIANVEFVLQTAELIKIELLDLNGKTLVSKHISANVGLNKLSLNISDLSSGVYSVIIDTEDGNITRKLVKG